MAGASGAACGHLPERDVMTGIGPVGPPQQAPQSPFEYLQYALDLPIALISVAMSRPSGRKNCPTKRRWRSIPVPPGLAFAAARVAAGADVAKGHVQPSPRCPPSARPPAAMKLRQLSDAKVKGAIER